MDLIKYTEQAENILLWHNSFLINYLYQHKEHCEMDNFDKIISKITVGSVLKQP